MITSRRIGGTTCRASQRAPSMPRPSAAATFIGGGAGLHKVLDLTELGVEFPFTAIFTTKKFAAGESRSRSGVDHEDI